MDALRKIREYNKIARILSKGRFAATKLFFRLLSVPLRKKIVGRKPIGLSLSFTGKDFYFFVRDAADIAVLREMFVEREYDLHSLVSPHHIVDIGSHIGGSTVFFKLTYPDAQITAYEPDPANFLLLKANTKEFDGVTCVNAAVSSVSGVADLYSHAGSSISGSLIQRDKNNEKRTVVTVSLDDVLKSGGAFVDVVKFDVEGAEFDIFSSSSNLDKVGSYVGELHLDLAPGKKKSDFYTIFSTFDIREKTVNKDRSILEITKKQ